MTEYRVDTAAKVQDHPSRPLHIAVRVDASAAMGTGHLRRCLALTQALQEQGAQVTLIVRALDGVAQQVLQSFPVPVLWLPPAPAGLPVPATADLPPHHAWAGIAWQQDAQQTSDALRGAPTDWLVVDHYAFDSRWHDAVRQGLGCRLLVVDDVADRQLSADILLDHNWAADHSEKYQGRLPRHPVWLVGPRYALLSAAYRAAPRYRFRPEVRSLGIFMGGTDPGGISARVLDCVRNDVGFTGAVEVVSTSASPHLEKLRKACATSPGTTLTLDEPDLAAFFARHDLQIGAGGGATWERCCIGIPTIALVIADNQAASITGLHQMGALLAACLPLAPTAARESETRTLSCAVRELLQYADVRQQMGESALALVDGRGAQRVALRLTRDTLQIRPATPTDAAMLHKWRNQPAVRAVSLNTAPITMRDHLAWLEKVLVATDRWLFVAQVGNLPVGSIRFDRLETTVLEVSLYLDPELQGLGLGREMLLRGEQKLCALLGCDLTFLAVVISGNRSSCQLFESNGYQGGPPSFSKQVTRHANALEAML